VEEPFVMVPVALQQDLAAGHLLPIDLGVYVAIFKRERATKKTYKAPYPGHDLLASDTNTSIATVDRSVRRLRQRRHLFIKRRPNETHLYYRPVNDAARAAIGGITRDPSGASGSITRDATDPSPVMGSDPSPVRDEVEVRQVEDSSRKREPSDDGSPAPPAARASRERAAALVDDLARRFGQL
jgi:hypothetical protein